MYKNLLKFLQFRVIPIEEERIKEVESKYDCKLPPIYKSFITVFKPDIPQIKVYSPRTNEYLPFITSIYSSKYQSNYTIDDDEFSFEGFMELEECFRYDNFKYERIKFGIIPISHHAANRGFMLGINNENQDKIFLMEDSLELCLLADNIFELIQKMQSVVTDFVFPELNTSKLYKNWGEDFWRIKEEKEKS